MEKTKLKFGDSVRIVKYGHPIFIHANEKLKPAKWRLIEKTTHGNWYDMMPELVGQIATVAKVRNDQNNTTYKLSGLIKTAWYNDEQLEKI